MKKKDITGETFGRLVVIKEEKVRNHLGHVTWRCKCSCGKQIVVSGCYLRKKGTRSCGCLKIKHGYACRNKKHPLYHIWIDIKKRCLNKKHKSYANYGAKGITICDEWLVSPSAFIKWAIKAGWNEGLFIDRKNNKKGYSPQNCRFVTQQANNSNKTNLYRNNTSGTKGVGVSKSGRYTARIDHFKKTYWLGTFDSSKEAAAAINRFKTNHGIMKK